MSLRTKLALILFLATALPFGLGAGAMDLVVAPAYRREAAHGSLEMTRRLADHVAWNLAREVTRLERIASWREVRAAAAGPGLSEQDARDLDRRWPKLPPESEPLHTILSSSASRALRDWQQTNPTAAELLVTNVRGQVAAASGKTPDFIQSDEPWWKRSYGGGAGRIYVSDARYEGGTRTWTTAVAMPVFRDAVSGTRVVGVLKAELDTVRAFQEMGRAELGDSGEAMLVDQAGRILIAPSAGEPDAPRLPAALLPLQEEAGSARTLRRPDGSYLYAWAEVPLVRQLDRPSAHLPLLYVVTRRSTAELFAPLRTVQWAMVLISLITIAAAMALGYWLGDALVVRHVRMLAFGMRELAQGRFERAAAIAERLAHLAAHPSTPNDDGSGLD